MVADTLIRVAQMNFDISLRSGLAGELRGVAYLRESLKLTVRALYHRRATDRWLRFLNSHPMFSTMLPTCPRLVNKIYRSYFSTTLCCEGRLAALQTHYGMVIRHGLAPLVASAACAPVVLCRLAARADLGYSIQLRAAGILDREGDLVLQLVHGTDLVCSIAFSFMQHERGTAIGIGCLQGPPGDAGLERIRAATRELHGLRPKNLLVRLVRQLGHDFDCPELVLVANRNRVVTNASRKGKVHADYDALWEELHAWRRPDGDFGLACEDLPAPCMESIPSKKRSEARKRHELLLAAIDAIRTHLARAKRESSTLRLVYSADAVQDTPAQALRNRA